MAAEARQPRRRTADAR
uniref:Uncharacterized protein n=1 Tax=Oryctolagus cuniculus TaxID=9986 RepID=A2N6G3_RABIT|nr:unknown protein [Oryctolagus cuniculus]